jgi:hypothetical protein
MTTAPSIILKIESLRDRTRMLTRLRQMIALKQEQDIRKEQWDLLENQLSAVSNKIMQQLRIIGDRYLAERESVKTRKLVINRLGELELELTHAFGFYDTFMDILTQRLSDDIGPLLKGCDVIAADAMQRGMIADLTMAPLVYCDRGFGAATLREGVNVLRNFPNPIPFISIPYSRLHEKYNLISINHEVGHQALIKLNLVKPLATLFRTAAARAGAPPLIQNFFASWSKELGPDFWAFCLSGMAQTCSLRDVLILPNHHMFQIATANTHPPAYLRFLVSTEWCRQLWGIGEWDSWEEEWKQLYAPQEMDAATCEIIETAKRFIPAIARACIRTRFRRLDKKTLPELFDMEELKPGLLRKHASSEGLQLPSFKKLSIGAQLAAFRLMRETRKEKPSVIDQYMNQWLKDIQNQQNLKS